MTSNAITTLELLSSKVKTSESNYITQRAVAYKARMRVYYVTSGYRLTTQVQRRIQHHNHKSPYPSVMSITCSLFIYMSFT